MKTVIFYVLILFFLARVPVKTQPSNTYLFIGSYTEGDVGEGIYVYRFDTLTGDLSKVYQADNLINPSFLTISSDGRYLYACTETKLDRNGSVSAFSINKKTGALSFINKQDAGGRNPVQLISDKKNRVLINSNYTDAGISIFPLRKNGGIKAYTQLLPFKGQSIISGRQEEAHIHSAVLSPDEKYLFAPDLGADRIRVLSLNKGHLEPLTALEISCTPGAGPRHFCFHPNGLFAYCVEELSGTVSSYSYHNGQLKLIDRDFSYSKIQETYGAADIHISPDGRFLYASNRWSEENTITIFAIDRISGTLSLLGHQTTFGDHPRSFVIDPSGNFLIVANQATGLIVVFRRDKITGLLKKTNTEIQVSLPSSLKMYSY